MKFIIHPFEGVELEGKGLIEFGMHWSKVRQFFDEPPQGRPGDIKGTYIDHWENLGIQIEYDAQYQFESCTIPVRSGCSVNFKEHEILQRPYVQVIQGLEALGVQLIEVKFAECFDAINYGFSIGKSYPEEEYEDDDVTPPQIFIFRQGYRNVQTTSK
jgi:hypothetical protein